MERVYPKIWHDVTWSELRLGVVRWLHLPSRNLAATSSLKFSWMNCTSESGTRWTGQEPMTLVSVEDSHILQHTGRHLLITHISISGVFAVWFPPLLVSCRLLDRSRDFRLPSFGQPVPAHRRDTYTRSRRLVLQSWCVCVGGVLTLAPLSSSSYRWTSAQTRRRNAGGRQGFHKRRPWVWSPGGKRKVALLLCCHAGGSLLRPRCLADGNARDREGGQARRICSAPIHPRKNGHHIQIFSRINSVLSASHSFGSLTPSRPVMRLRMADYGPQFRQTASLSQDRSVFDVGQLLPVWSSIDRLFYVPVRGHSLGKVRRKEVEREE